MSKSYTHTPENMLETHTGGARSQSNLYNGDGQRVQKEEGSDVTESKTSGYSGFENKLQHIGAIHDELTGPLYLNARYYISPSNELCELQTDLCKKRPNLRFGCVLLPSPRTKGSSLGTATEEKGRMQIRGIYMRTAPITRSTMWIRAGINSFQYINIKIRRDINLQ